MANYFSKTRGDYSVIVPFENVSHITIMGKELYIYLKTNVDLDEPISVMYELAEEAVAVGQEYIQWLEEQDIHCFAGMPWSHSEMFLDKEDDDEEDCECDDEEDCQGDCHEITGAAYVIGKDEDGKTIIQGILGEDNE